MAKFTKEAHGVLVTVITSQQSAVGSFIYEGKYYSSTVKGKMILPEDVESLIDSAVKLLDQFYRAKFIVEKKIRGDR